MWKMPWRASRIPNEKSRGVNLNNPYAAPDATLSEVVSQDGTYEPKVFSLHGRIGRLRYLAYSWGVMFVLTFAAGFIVAALAPALGIGATIVGGLLYVVGIVGSLVMTKRRLNDLDHSGWLSLLMLVPLVNFIFGLYLIFGRGTEGANRYGLPPTKNSALLVIAGLLLPIICVVGILAAVAIPAYQQYTLRAKAAAAQQHQQP
jgi:uncharacterized membrane protein YhaH (DUF805 family)